MITLLSSCQKTKTCLCVITHSVKTSTATITTSEDQVSQYKSKNAKSDCTANESALYESNTTINNNDGTSPQTITDSTSYSTSCKLL